MLQSGQRKTEDDMFLHWWTAMGRFKAIALIGLLLFPVLACNTLSGGEGAPTSSPIPELATEPPVEPGPSSTATVEPADLPPTETPVGQATLFPTPTGAALQPTPTLAMQETNTPAVGDFPPLTFVWEIGWELNEGNPGMATATITVTVAGGSGQYTYFHDDIVQDGPVFSYQWASCKPRPGSVRVDSSDGQSVKEDYFERSPCPATNTPTP